MEYWKDITTYLNYEVSTYGRIRNKATGRVLMPQTMSKGYLGVRLYDSGNGKTYKIHRLVALAFISGNFDGAQVNHKDGNKSNNNIDNLEWLSNKDNHEHAITTGLWSPTFKIGEDKREAALEMLSSGLSTRAVASKLGVGKSWVHKLTRRK